MPDQDPLERVHLSLHKSMVARVDMAVVDASAREYGLDRTEYMRRAIAFYLDHNEEVTGSRAALAHKVGDRINDKLELVILLLLIILKIIATQWKLPTESIQEHFDWAGQNLIGMQLKLAQLRNANRPQQDFSRRAGSHLNTK